MFHSARIKLTAWYLLIIMFISFSFTVAIYRVLTFELDRVERIQRLRIERRLSERFRIPSPVDMKEESLRSFFLDPELITEAKNHLKIILAVINFVIFGTSSLAGYFLAGRTLKPIKEMVDEQKRFVADASHELRTPLTAIKTETEVAVRNRKLDLKSAKRLIASNLEEINKLKSLTDYFLTLSKYQSAISQLMERKNIQFSFAVFNLSEAVKETCERLQNLAKKKKIRIVKNLKKVSIKANRISITELTTILLDNAIKYSHAKGTVKISIETKRNIVKGNFYNKGNLIFR